jgi:ribosomal-protein-alanine N-acetyltransferase
MKKLVRVASLSAEDEDDFIAAAAESRVLHGRWVSAPSTPEAFRAKLQRLDGESSLGLCVRRLDTDALAGFVEITQIVRGSLCSAYLGYYAFAPHAGRGFMKGGLRHVVRLAFTKLGLHRLEANIQPENIASIRLVQACGFAKEGYSPRYLKIAGRWRDHERWAIRAS